MAVGQTLANRYRLDKELGRGGMGVVYRAHDELLDRDIAIKIMSDPRLSEDGRARLLREAQAAAQLNHPNIVSVYDAGEQDGQPYIVMELVTGSSLHDAPPQTVPEIISIARQVSAALAHAHSHGIIHRDIKPENVLLTPEGTAKLMDFGLARVTVAPRLTQDGLIVGTGLYLSPEQLRGEKFDARTDLYSLGVMLYELLTGHPPFTGDTPMSIISQHLYSAPEPPRALRADMPPALEGITLRLLAKDPNDRFESAHALEIALAAMEPGIQSKTIGTPRHNLPILLNTFVGREHEMAQIKKMLLVARLVSLTGAGGCGKTRLALQVANEVIGEYPDGVWLVELASLADASLIPQTVAAAVGLLPEPNRPLTDTLIDYLNSRTVLLLFDNCEHMIDSVARLIESMLHACPNLHVMTTSREALGIAGELAFRVPSLETPDPQHPQPVERVAQYDAVRLFVDRAASVSPDFHLTEQNVGAVTQICRRLDGIPLALELAAARVRALSVDQIATRLDDRFRLLTGGSRTALPRQQTLRALIDWSYGLLTDAECMMLRRVSVFAGGWTLDAVESICSCNHTEAIDVLDLLLRLVDKSLVVADKPEGETRYRMLETIRQYARDKLLESGEAETLRACHLNFFLDFADGAEAKLHGAEQSVWLNRVDAEHDNLRAALEWSSEGGREQAALRLAAALWPFWEARGYFGDSRAWLEKLVAATPDAPAPVRAKALFGLGRLDRFQGRYADAELHLKEALAHFQELGDKRQIASVSQTLGEVMAEQGDFGAAQKRFAEALPIFQESADQPGMAGLVLSQGEIARVQGDYERAAALYLQALSLSQQIGDLRRQMIVLYNLGQVALHQGDPTRAASLFRNSLTLAETLSNKLAIAHCVAALAGAAGASGQLERAARLSGAAEAIFASIGARMDLADRIQYDRNLATVRGLLDENTFAAASAQGRAMPIEQAIKFAQEEPAD